MAEMALAPGTRFGEYEVLTKLGEGGMGECIVPATPGSDEMSL